jgi:hypothetical protein
MIDDVPGSLHGACARERAVGVFGAYAVRTAVRTGLLTVPWPRVLMEAERQLEPRTRAAAGLFAVGPSAVLCGFTAARLHGCDAVPAAGPVDLVVPYGTWPRRRPGLVVHHGRVAPQDVWTADGLPVLAPDLTIAELLCTARSARAALACADQACAAAPGGADGFVAAVLERIDRRADRRGTVRAAALAALVRAGARSPQESWLRLTVVEHGYPPPVVQHEVRDPCGAPVRRLDLAWPQVRIGLDYHGHAAPTGVEDRDLTRRGWVVVRATIEDLGRPARLLAELSVAFRRRGGLLGS